MDFVSVIKNAKIAALRDGYNQAIIESADGYSFSRIGYEKLVTSIFEDEKIVGIIKLCYENGIQKTAFSIC